MLSQTTTTTLLLLVANLTPLALSAPIQPRGNLPTPISATTAIQYLSTIQETPESNTPPYNRNLFNHWITINNQCNTRETVLSRDGTGVVTSSACAATAGQWYSDYDGKTWTEAASVDIDHLVPLKEAWVSGAKDWTDERREEFANE
jgi:hypothetical protein